MGDLIVQFAVITGVITWWVLLMYVAQALWKKLRSTLPNTPPTTPAPASWALPSVEPVRMLPPTPNVRQTSDWVEAQTLRANNHIGEPTNLLAFRQDKRA